mmetsp:Transcript_42118/g.120458  ORF Transcript_42118/g.120458 Transcript_42118/m.120458 type:complete len:256 (-) Transcript_42118:414-1181(-)
MRRPLVLVVKDLATSSMFPIILHRMRVERQAVRVDVVESGAETPDVTLLVVWTSLNLGGHVERSAGPLLQLFTLPKSASQAEVRELEAHRSPGQHRAGVLSEQVVVWLDVPVDKAVAVQEDEPGEHLVGEPCDRLGVHTTAIGRLDEPDFLHMGLEKGGQASSSAELHEEVVAFRALKKPVEFDDERVVELGGVHDLRDHGVEGLLARAQGHGLQRKPLAGGILLHHVHCAEGALAQVFLHHSVLRDEAMQPKNF